MTQAEPGRTIKQEQEETSRNHVQAFIPGPLFDSLEIHSESFQSKTMSLQEGFSYKVSVVFHGGMPQYGGDTTLEEASITLPPSFACRGFLFLEYLGLGGECNTCIDPASVMSGHHKKTSYSLYRILLLSPCD